MDGGAGGGTPGAPAEREGVPSRGGAEPPVEGAEAVNGSRAEPPEYRIDIIHKVYNKKNNYLEKFVNLKFKKITLNPLFLVGFWEQRRNER